MDSDLDLQALGLPAVLERQAVGGGSISRSWRVRLADGRLAFVKQHARPPSGFFAAEARGLARIAETACIATPSVLAVGPHHLVLSWIESSPLTPAGQQQLGQQLALMHAVSSEHFGFDEDNFCGLSPQPNPRMRDGHAFFREARLMYQGRMARQARKLSATDLQRLERLCGKLPSLVPDQSPALIHGDLWSGNVMADRHGRPVLIDPAVHFGWPEAELAMTRLFGGFGEAFYRSYADHNAALLPDWEQRVPLYNLYHLLNHLNLFGGGYLQSVRTILNRFA